MNAQLMSAEEAVKLIQSGDRVFIHGSAATPLTLLKTLAENSGHLHNVEMLAISTLGELAIAKPEFKDHFYFNSLFVSENIRPCVNSENGEYIPIFLSEISKLFEKGILPIDVAMIHCPNKSKHATHTRRWIYS